MPININLKIERQYNGVINCINNLGSNPKSLETTLNNLKDIFKISNRDYYYFYKLALQNDRPDLAIILLRVINNINIPLRTYDDIFYTICTKKSQYLKDFLNSSWIDLVDIGEIYDILIEKTINYLSFKAFETCFIDIIKTCMFNNFNCTTYFSTNTNPFCFAATEMLRDRSPMF